MRKSINVIILTLCTLITICVFNGFAQDSETEKCRAFLGKYGWEVAENPFDSADVIIPEVFDEVYKSYNIIQQEAGLDLTAYKGKKGKRYTYEVLNYPLDVGETVYANVVCISGEPCAGDIMTVSVNGFMHSLMMPQ